jgi:radical SAM superfamily enzyme YgiQ (UPF0313 family)
LIGNKRAMKPILRDIAAWQERLGYPLTFFTEASLDLADDPELLDLMVQANIVAVFVGIESPDPASLTEARKGQNLRGSRTIVDKVHDIQAAGLEVWCGMILGFDNDGPGVFEAHRRFLGDARIVHAMTGLLTALPKTPLYDRLARAGRVDPDERWRFGTNVIPLGMTREELRDGYVQLLERLYSAEAYFDRFEDLYIGGALRVARSRMTHWQRHPWRRRAEHARILVRGLGLALRLSLWVPDAGLRREYRRRAIRLLRCRHGPDTLFTFLISCAIHFHVHTLVRSMVSGERVASIH